MSAKTSAALTSGLEPAPGHGLAKRLGARCYDSIGEAAQSLDFSGGEAPGIDALNDLMRRRAKPIVTAGGHSVRFSEQNMDPSALGYESQIFETGSVPTRPNSMHDLFNALVWLTFPLTKAAINHRHIAARASPTPGGNRGAAQDLLTLFDECGVLVVSDRPELLDLIAAFQWKELFWTRRDETTRHMKFFVFGHGLMEQLLTPYIGLTGKALMLNIETAWLQASTDALLQHIDALSRTLIASPAGLSKGRDLAPFPVLGIPGWAAENNRESYYGNARYFRPGRRADS